MNVTLSPVDQDKPVHTTWDVGSNDDSQIIWFYQMHGAQLRIVNFFRLDPDARLPVAP